MVEKLDDALGKLSVAARAELELVELRRKVIIIHKQRVFLAIVCHYISKYERQGFTPVCRRVHPPSCSPSVSQCALKTRMPFGLYLASNAGPKSRRKLATGLSLPPCWRSARIWGFWLAGSLENMRMGEPWAKKKAGMWSGDPGRVARRSCQAGRVSGRASDD